MNTANVLINSSNTYEAQTCLVFNDSSWSYQQMSNLVLKVAQGLREFGIKENDRVALILGNKPEYIISYFSILSLGGIVVPINPSFKERETSFILTNAEVKAAIVDCNSSKILSNIKNSCPDLTKVFSIEEKETIDLDQVPFSTLLESDKLSGLCNKSSDDIAQIIYTSGTTGEPKGAMITHGNLTWMVSTLKESFEITKDDRVLTVLPLFHAYAKLQCLLSPIFNGSTIYLIEHFNANECLNILENKKITVFFGVPTMFVKFVQASNIGDYSYLNLRLCVSGGASLPVEILKKFQEKTRVEILEGYGLTESTVMSACNPYQGEKKPGSIGRPLKGLEVKIINPDGEMAAAGERGELLIKGPNVMKGYYKKEEETLQAIVDGWLHSGDIAAMDEDGYLYIIDRKKEMIIRNGYNVYPREIEEVLYTLPQVAECAVIGFPDESHGEEIAAYVTKCGEISEDEIKEHCMKFLAPYKWPRVVQFIDELPKTLSGKITKHALKDTGNNLKKGV